MRILFSGENLYPSIGGAEESMQTVLKHLKIKNHVAAYYIGEKWDALQSYVSSFPKISPYHLREYMYNFLLKKELFKIFDKFKPDLLLTQLQFTPGSVEVAKKRNIKSIVFLRSYEHFCLDGFINGYHNKELHSCFKHTNIKEKLNYPFFQLLRKKHENALSAADLIISNSYYMKRVLKEWYNLNSKVVYPFIDLDKYKTELAENNILHVNAIEHKGIELTLNIAKKLPKKNFIIVGYCSDKYIKKIKEIKNVEYYGYISDMKKIYSEVRLILMPSIWSEPFGRIPIEAGISGIPTIASNIGGLSESVGKGGILIDDFYNVDQWVEFVLSLDDNKLYNKLSKKAIAHSKDFNFENTFRIFKNIVQEELEILL